MGRTSRKNQEPQPGLSNGMEVDSDSDSDEELSLLQVSRNMKRINVSRAGRRGKTRGRQLDSDSDEELQASRNTQRMNGSRKGQRDRTNARRVDSDSDEEPQPSTSQASQKKRQNNASQSQRACQALSQATTSGDGDTLMGEEIPASQISPNTSLTEQEFHHHVANAVKYILSADNQKKVPIEKSKISKDINCHNKTFRDVFKSAREVLKDVFGYVMVDMEEDDKNQGKQSKSQKFILVNTVDCEDLHDNDDEETNTRYALLFLSLTHIFMSGDKCTEDSLMGFLKKLEIVTEQHTRHEQFEDPMATIMIDFVKEKYINVHGPDKELTWGIRAIKELKPRAVMEFASMIYDGRGLETWPQQHELLLKKELEMNQRPNGQVNGAHR